MTNKFFADFLCLSSQVVYLDTPNKPSFTGQPWGLLLR